MSAKDAIEKALLHDKECAACQEKLKEMQEKFEKIMGEHADSYNAGKREGIRISRVYFDTISDGLIKFIDDKEKKQHEKSE